MSVEAEPTGGDQFGLPGSGARALAPTPTWSFRPRPKVASDTKVAAREMVNAAKRRRAAPVRKVFVRTDMEDPAPLSQLARIGGRGGAVAIKLYLALLWRCSSAPFHTDKPARAWASLLALEEPETKGALRISAALKTLEAANLITVNRLPGRNVVTVLDESGDGSDYQLPSTEYYLASMKGSSGQEQARRNRYFKISSRWWTEGDLQTLKGPGLIMLLILLAEQGGDDKLFADGGVGKGVWFSTTVFPARYRVSHKTRAAGTRELLTRRLLIVEREALPDVPGSVFARRRYRNIYKLINPPSDDVPDGT